MCNPGLPAALVAAWAAAAVGLIAPGVARAELAQIPVITGPSDQNAVAAEGNMIAWSRSMNLGPNNLFVRVGAGPVTRVNPAGTQASPGGFSGERLIFQQAPIDPYSGVRSDDLRFYNAVHHTYGVLPAGWSQCCRGYNTPYEYSPTISGRYVLFGRYNPFTKQAKVVLGDLATRRLKLLASGGWEQPGQVNGNWATWSDGCNVYRYSVTNGHTARISNTFAGGGCQTSSSVAHDGTLYFFHWDSGGSCEYSDLTLNKQVLGRRRAVLVSFAPDLIAGNSYVDDATGTPIIYYPRSVCTAGADIYKVVDSRR